MGSYGRNFEFRIPPRSEDRKGRFVAFEDAIVIGAPVMADDAEGYDTFGLQYVTLAAADSAPTPGRCGICVYEHAPEAFNGYDSALTTYSDLGVAPAEKAVQVVSGTYVKVVFTNTPATQNFYTRPYTGRKMVDGLGATPTVTEGDFLIPGTGNDSAGYWKSTATASGAWMVITKVDTVRLEVEAQMLF